MSTCSTEVSLTIEDIPVAGYKVCDWDTIKVTIGAALAGCPASAEPEWNGVFDLHDEASNSWYFLNQSIGGREVAANHSPGYPDGDWTSGASFTRLNYYAPDGAWYLMFYCSSTTLAWLGVNTNFQPDDPSGSYDTLIGEPAKLMIAPPGVPCCAEDTDGPTPPWHNLAVADDTVVATATLGLDNNVTPVSFGPLADQGEYRVEYVSGYFSQQQQDGSHVPTGVFTHWTSDYVASDRQFGPRLTIRPTTYFKGTASPCIVPDVEAATLAKNPMSVDWFYAGDEPKLTCLYGGAVCTAFEDVAGRTGSITYRLRRTLKLMPQPSQIRVKSLATFVASLRQCETIVAAASPEWDGTLPLRYSQGYTNLSYAPAGTVIVAGQIATSFPPLSLGGKELMNGDAFNKYGPWCGWDGYDKWIFELYGMDAGGARVLWWRGEKRTGYTPEGTYLMKSGGCSNAPLCLKMEAY